ncbi:MAG: radical SAM protein [Clostridia bacterium]|nr:radical SAM protein [Clostridia bacterium]
MRKFKKIYIEITNICNLSCAFCPKSKRSPGMMPAEVFEEILAKIRGCSEYLYFHVKGEPLLHPELGGFLELAARHGLRVNITTNGTLIGKMGKVLISSPALRQVNFSLHSFESKEFSKTLDGYLRDIFLFISDAKKQRELNIALRLWNSKAKGQNRHILDEIAKEFGLEAPIVEEPSHIRGIKMDEKVFLHIAEPFEWPDIGAEELGSSGFCYGLRDQIAILVDGTVVPCCLDGEGAIALGNILEKDLASIIEGERAKHIYEGFSRRVAVEGLCRKCSYRSRFS